MPALTTHANKLLHRTPLYSLIELQCDMFVVADGKNVLMIGEITVSCLKSFQSSFDHPPPWHRWTGRYEAHLWDKNCWNESQKKKGRQGAYDEEDVAAHAYDLAALKYWGEDTILNFPVATYPHELKEMEGQSREAYIGSLRRKSNGFSRGVSKFRGVARHHHNGRWEARIGRVFGNKYLYLGTYATQEEAAVAYDMAAVEYRGLNAVTNFHLSRYVKWLKPNNNNKTLDASSNLNSNIIDANITSCAINEIGCNDNHNHRPNQLEHAVTTPATSEVMIPYSSHTSALGLLLKSSKFKELMDMTNANEFNSKLSYSDLTPQCDNYLKGIEVHFEGQDIGKYNGGGEFNFDNDLSQHQYMKLYNLYTTSLQRDKISLKKKSLNVASELEGLKPTVEVSDRERSLVTKVSELQSMLTSLTEELTTEKLKYLQENLQHWLTDEKGRDQFVIRVGPDTEVLWNDARQVKAIFSDDSGDEEESSTNTNQPNDPTTKIEVANTALTRIVAGDFLESLGNELGLEDGYFGDESAEVVVSSLRLGDDQGSLFTNSNWFAFQYNIEDNAPNSATSASAMLDEANLNGTSHGGNSSSENEVAVGEDEDLVTCNSTSTSDPNPLIQENKETDGDLKMVENPDAT
ncbi:AP2-like ethylene-responsive transcription factor [Tanacetum coccineum]|uniref:AP2-like ethylene-responsive transcription factor n=1 Tax=Tanacetum coccineum TaxID=301880 RepID=A0ABQ5AXP0_9ASTR